MSALDPANERKLKASLARLASPHDGEIIAAVAAVGRILSKAGLDFTDLEVRLALPSPLTRARVRCGDHQNRAYLLLMSGYPWTDWSHEFLTSISGWANPLSAKQESILRSMEREAAAWTAERAT